MSNGSSAGQPLYAAQTHVVSGSKGATLRLGTTSLALHASPESDIACFLFFFLKTQYLRVTPKRNSIFFLGRFGRQEEAVMVDFYNCNHILQFYGSFRFNDQIL